MRGQKGYPMGKGSFWRRKAHPKHPLTLPHDCFATPAIPGGPWIPRFDVDILKSPTCWRFSQPRGAKTSNMPKTVFRDFFSQLLEVGTGVGSF